LLTAIASNNIKKGVNVMRAFFLTFALLVLLTLDSAMLNAQWVQTNGPGGGNVACFAVSGPNLFAGTENGGVYLSTDNGTSWTEVNDGLTQPYVYALAVSGTNLFAGTNGGGVFLSTNNGTSWTEVNNGLPTDARAVQALAVSGTNLFAGNYTGVFLSTNNGTSWTEVNNGLPTDARYVLALAVSGTNLFAGTSDGGVFLSTNNGTSWTAVNNGLTNLYVQALAPDLSGNLFAGTRGGGVFLSTNNGTSWTAVNSGLTNSSISSLAVSGTNLFAGTNDGGVFLSTNNGTSWTEVSAGWWTEPWLHSLAVSGTNIFVGTNSSGVFLSTNNGTSWTEVNSGLTNTNIRALAVSDTNLFAGTHGGGVWRRPLTEMITSVERLQSDVPMQFSLSQNYPNPFNPATTISFSIPTRSFVSLKVYDAVGREVSTLVSEELAAGMYSKQWEAAGFASGTYFYRLQAGTFTETKKLILLR
jgi:photosystem II stability/assembly factor-like uncharacterized protein